jgi:hypothetical protein
MGKNILTIVMLVSIPLLKLKHSWVFPNDGMQSKARRSNYEYTHYTNLIFLTHKYNTAAHDVITPLFIISYTIDTIVTLMVTMVTGVTLPSASSTLQPDS